MMSRDDLPDARSERCAARGAVRGIARGAAREKIVRLCKMLYNFCQHFLLLGMSEFVE